MAGNVDMGDEIYQKAKSDKHHGAPSRFEVTLTEAEVRICAWVGKQRYANAVSQCRNPGKGSSSTDETPNNHIRGAMAEFAASVAFNLHWRPAVSQIDKIDVGGIIETRTTIIPTGRLIIKPQDIKKSPHTPFLLVDCQGLDKGFFRMCGWRLAKDAPDLAELDKRHGDPAYYIIKNNLNSNESLVDWVSVRRVFD